MIRNLRPILLLTTIFVLAGFYSGRLSIYTAAGGIGDDLFYDSLASAIVERDPLLLKPLGGDACEWIDEEAGLAFGQWSPGQSVAAAVSTNWFGWFGSSMEARAFNFEWYPIAFFGLCLIWLATDKMAAASLAIFLIAMPATIDVNLTESLAMPFLFLAFHAWVRISNEKELSWIDELLVASSAAILLILRSYAAAIAWPALFLIAIDKWQQRKFGGLLLPVGITFLGFIPVLSWNQLMTGEWLKNPYFFEVGEFKAFASFQNLSIAMTHASEGLFARYPAVLVGFAGLIKMLIDAIVRRDWRLTVAHLLLVLAIILQVWVMVSYFYLTQGRFLFAAALPLAYGAVYLARSRVVWQSLLIICVAWTLFARDLVTVQVTWSSLLHAVSLRTAIAFLTVDNLAAIAVTVIIASALQKSGIHRRLVFSAALWPLIFAISLFSYRKGNLGSLAVLILTAALCFIPYGSWRRLTSSFKCRRLGRWVATTELWVITRWVAMLWVLPLLSLMIYEYGRYHMAAYPMYSACNRQNAYHACFMVSHRDHLMKLGIGQERVIAIDEALGLQEQPIEERPRNSLSFLAYYQFYTMHYGNLQLPGIEKLLMP